MLSSCFFNVAGAPVGGAPGWGDTLASTKRRTSFENRSTGIRYSWHRSSKPVGSYYSERNQEPAGNLEALLARTRRDLPEARSCARAERVVGETFVLG